MEPCFDPEHEWNGAKYHTGKTCITPACNNPAGTAWSPLWCFECNSQRMGRIDMQLEDIKAALDKQKE